MARFVLTDFEWSVIKLLLPQKPRGVARVDDRRVLNGIFWRLRMGAPSVDIPARYGPNMICVNRFNRWRKARHWACILQFVSEAYKGDVQMIDFDPTIRRRSENRRRGLIRVHQHGSNGSEKGGDAIVRVVGVAA